MLTRLQEYGCDVEHTLERFVNDEAFYWECFDMLFSGDALEQLGESLRRGDTEEAFICAHGMKGTVSNLGLTPLFHKLEPVVEMLRGGKTDGVIPLYDSLCEEWEICRKIRQ